MTKPINSKRPSDATDATDVTDAMDSSVFRAYDIRGSYPNQINERFAFNLARAIAKKCQIEALESLVLGWDARHSSNQLASFFIAGLTDQNPNLKIYIIGQVPTPFVYFATRKNGGLSKSGVMITASHNPKDDNGFKLAINARRLFGAEIKSLYEMMNELEAIDAPIKPFDLSAQSKSQSTSDPKIEWVDIKPQYLNALNDSIKLKKTDSKQKIKVVLDAGNGITGAFAPDFFQSFGFEVLPLYCELDGNFPNHPPDSSRAENLVDLSEKVIQEKADLGLAFDGDGDRLGVVDNQGKVIALDLIILLFALDIAKNNQSQGKKTSIIHDVKCSNLLQEILAQQSVEVMMCATGHSFISKKITETNAEFAGEMSGHLFFNDRWGGFDDGIYAGLRLAELLQNSDQSMAELCADFPNYYNTPEILIAFDDDREKFNFINQFTERFKNQSSPDYDLYHLDGVRLNFKPHFALGWGLIRASNTSPKLTIRFEAKDQSSLNKIAQFFIEQFQFVDEKIATKLQSQINQI